VSRLKFLKRQMYVQASFELLPARVLPFGAVATVSMAAAVAA